jgi:hypothetical protein
LPGVVEAFESAAGTLDDDVAVLALADDDSPDEAPPEAALLLVDESGRFDPTALDVDGVWT